MPTYTYRAADRSGKVEKKQLTARNEQALEIQIEKTGEHLIEVLKTIQVEKKPVSSGKIRPADRIEMAYHISVMCAAGIPVLNALEDFARQKASPSLKKILLTVVEDINKGQLLSEALANHPRAFDDVFVNLVKAGETSGSLDLVMERYYKELEWQSGIKAHLVQAMVYPAFLLLALTGLVVLLLTFLLPKVIGLLPGSGADLPLPTKVLVSASGFVQSYWWLLLGLAVAVPIGIKLMRLTARGLFLTDFVLMKIPAVGSVVHDVSVARFISTLRTLYGSGVEVVCALDIAGHSAGNEVIRVRIGGLIDDVTQGATLSEAFKKVKEFNSMIQSMIGMCEKTGQTPEALEKITGYFDTSIPRKVKKMISIMEPTIITLAGLLVGFVLVGTLMPLFNLYSSF